MPFFAMLHCRLFAILSINFLLFAGANLLHMPALAGLALNHMHPQWWQVRLAVRTWGMDARKAHGRRACWLNACWAAKGGLPATERMSTLVAREPSPFPLGAVCDGHLHARQLAASQLQRLCAAGVWAHGGGGGGGAGRVADLPAGGGGGHTRLLPHLAAHRHHLPGSLGRRLRPVHG